MTVRTSSELMDSRRVSLPLRSVASRATLEMTQPQRSAWASAARSTLWRLRMAVGPTPARRIRVCPPLDIAHTEAGDRHASDWVIGNRGSAPGVITFRRLRPHPVVGLAPQPEHIGDGATGPDYGIRTPEMALAITKRWISDVPSKIV